MNFIYKSGDATTASPVVISVFKEQRVYLTMTFLPPMMLMPFCILLTR